MKREVRRKIALLLAILMILSSFPMGEVSAAQWDYVETFDSFNASGTSYTQYTFNGVHNETWTANGSRGAEAAGYVIDGEGVLLGGETKDDSYLTTTVQDGIGSISIDIKRHIQIAIREI